jgi:anti-sigma regulatory factor (Ser/Thr protein kinase)
MSLPLPLPQGYRAPCRPESMPPLLIVAEEGGGDDDLAVQCAALGLRLGDKPVDGQPCILAAAADDDRVRRGLAAPYSGFIELGSERLLGVGLRCFEAVRRGGVTLSLLTGSAYSLRAMELTSEVVRRDFGVAEGEAADLIDICLGEAIGNAVIHGNLGIPGHLRATQKGFQRFCQIMQDRLVDPVLSGRRVELNISSRGLGQVSIAVTDQGRGFDLASQLSRGAETDGTHGRGLGLIRRACVALHAEDDGRTLVMSFSY